MALAPKQDNCMERDRVPAEIIRIPQHDVRAPSAQDSGSTVRQTWQEYGKRGTQMITATKQSAQEIYKGTRTHVAQGYSRLATKTKDLARRTQHVARQAKQEHPVQLLAVVAGVAFVAGVALRIWRSRV